MVVVDLFQVHLCILACVMSREFTREGATKFLPAQFPWIWNKYLLFNLFKDFQSDLIQGSSRRSERNLCNCVKKPDKKFRTSTGFEPVTSRYRCDTLPTELWSHWRWEQWNPVEVPLRGVNDKLWSRLGCWLLCALCTCMGKNVGFPRLTRLKFVIHTPKTIPPFSGSLDLEAKIINAQADNLHTPPPRCSRDQ